MKMGKKEIVATVVIVSIIILFLLPVVPVSYTVKEPYEVTKRESQTLINDKPTVKAGYYIYYKRYIDVSQKEGNIVYGSIIETSGNDINFYVFDQKGFNAWKNGQSVSPYVYAKRVKSYTFSFVPDHTDYYYFVLDNTYSWFTNKVPKIEATWDYKITVTEYRDVKKTKYISVLQLLLES